MHNADAFPIPVAGTEGFQVFATGTGSVIAKYEGNSASYSNDLYLNGVKIFNNQETPVGTTMDLGQFSAGEELVFELFVRNTGYRYYTGSPSRNPDNKAHARVQKDWASNTTLVSFEDLFEGPFNYNDLSFSFTNTSSTPSPPVSVPEPGTLLLVAATLGGLAFSRRKSTNPGCLAQATGKAAA